MLNGAFLDVQPDVQPVMAWLLQVVDPQLVLVISHQLKILKTSSSRLEAICTASGDLEVLHGVTGFQGIKAAIGEDLAEMKQILIIKNIASYELYVYHKW